MTDPVVDDYLRRLDSAARVLPDDRRRELVDEIAAHIAESRAGGAVAGPADLRTLLDRLGEPEEIVAAARDEDSTGRPPTAGPLLSADGAHVHDRRRPGTGTEIAAVLMLTVGSIVPVIGWLVGVVLVWMSRRWRTWEKVLATVVFPGGPGLALIAGTLGIGGGGCSSSTTSAGGVEVGESSCTHHGPPVGVGVALFVVWVTAPIVVGIVLLVRARARAAAEPPVRY